MNKILISILSIIISATSFAADTKESKPFFSYHDLDQLAKTAMTDETNYVNEYLASGNVNIPAYEASTIPGYKAKNFKAKDVAFLLNKMGKTHIKFNFLYNKCTMSEKSAAAVISTELSQDNDGVGPEISDLKGVKTSYNKTIWELTSHMCNEAEARFTVRLGHATSNGTPLNLSDDTKDALAKLVFYPTVYGSPPTFLKSFRGFALDGITAGFIVGSALSLWGIPVAGVIISLSSIGANSLSIQDGLPKAENALCNLDFSLLGSANSVKLDLTDDEIKIN